PNPVHIDGKDSDWGQIADKSLQFGVDAEHHLVDGGFDLVLGERAGQLYAFMRIRDDALVYRDPGYLRLDTADSVRLSFIQDDGEDGRVAITFGAPGVTTAYRVGPEWKLAVTGASENQVQGQMEPTADGIDVEFRMPLSMLGSRRFFGLSYVDVDDPQTRAIRAITQTL